MAEYDTKGISLKDGRGLELINELETMFESCKKARRGQIPRWRRNEDLYHGKFLKPFNLPKYKTRIEPNIVHSVVETMYSILTDRNPKVDLMPKVEQDSWKARVAQDTIEYTFESQKAYRAISNMKRDGLIYGNGFLKIAMIEGEINYIVPDPFTVFIDPLATTIEDAKCVIFATPTYVNDIKEAFPGKEVGSEGNVNEYRSFVKNEDKYATDKVNLEEVSPASTVSSKDSDYGGGQAILKEAWYYKGDKLCLATWVGKTLLQKEEAPYDRIPVAMFKNYQSGHSIWGKGEPEVIESLAIGSSIALSQGMDNLIYHGNPAIVMSKSMAKVTGNRPTDKPGQIYYTNGPHERVDRLPAGNVSSSTLPMAESMIKLADSVSGVHDITQGRNPSGVTASRAIQQLQEASQQVIRAKERETGTDAIVDIYKITLSLIINNSEENINIRRIDEDGGGYKFEEVRPYDLDMNVDFRYVPGSSMPESRASRFDQAIDLLQLGLLDQEKFWRWINKDISKEILDEIMQQKKAQQEAMMRDQEIMQTSTDPQEIMDAQLRMKEAMMPSEEGGEDAKK